jgi:hypothetical protein
MITWKHDSTGELIHDSHSDLEKITSRRNNMAYGNNRSSSGMGGRRAGARRAPAPGRRQGAMGNRGGVTRRRTTSSFQNPVGSAANRARMNTSMRTMAPGLGTSGRLPGIRAANNKVIVKAGKTYHCIGNTFTRDCQEVSETMDFQGRIIANTAKSGGFTATGNRASRGRRRR